MSNQFQFRTKYRKLRAYLFPISHAVPKHLQPNFRHLYADIGWYALLVGGALSFLTVYAARLGASTTQIGLINAMPAIVSLFISLPAGPWLKARPLNKAILMSAMGQRIFYLFMALLPWLFGESQQIWALIFFTLVMSIPGTVISIGFNVVFASGVPMRYRGMVAGRRNALSAIITVIATLIFGRILTVLPFPLGYQVVFAVGFIGAAMSAYHLSRVKAVVDPEDPLPLEILADTEPLVAISGRKLNNLFLRIRDRLQFETLKGPFGRSLLLLTFFHFVHYLSIPIFPVFFVDKIHISDQVISLGNAIFYLMMFVGSTQINKISGKIGNMRSVGLGIVLLGIYPTMLSFAKDATLYYAASFFGGFAWSIVNVTMINYLLEKVPSNKRTEHFAWFSLAINAAVLLGSTLGPIFGDILGITLALFIFGILRIIAGLAVFKWG